ncbi:PfkB family carbohydrate kinase [Streptomyces olivaceus]|uniref:PfkB family carbohydrate kinase n=1 Tax=Streptomyces olivaceus TaxID=47716 RepID=UPI0033BEB72B
MPSAPPSPVADVVCVGETVAVLGPSDDRPLTEQESVRLGTGGAEPNAACALAGLGHRAAWLSRLGTRIRHYRRGSAAAGVGPQLARPPLPRRARLVHLSGITAALSESCGLPLDALLLGRHPGAEGGAAGPVVSFDVNHRPALWRDGPARAADRLLALARAADLVFVGRDEAEALWGTKHADDAAALLTQAPVVVVKDAETCPHVRRTAASSPWTTRRGRLCPRAEPGSGTAPNTAPALC